MRRIRDTFPNPNRRWDGLARTPLFDILRPVACGRHPEKSHRSVSTWVINKALMAVRYIAVVFFIVLGTIVSYTLFGLSSGSSEESIQAPPVPHCAHNVYIWDSINKTAKPPAGYPSRGIVYAVASMQHTNERGRDKAAALLDYTFRAAIKWKRFPPLDL
eukprot:5947365-Pyramimonas_sp.AAC.1